MLWESDWLISSRNEWGLFGAISLVKKVKSDHSGVVVSEWV